MTRDTVYLELMTRRTAADVGGWDKKHEMGIAVAVTYSSRLQDYCIYAEDQTDDLIKQLVQADLVVGYHQVGFDYEVMLGYTLYDFRDQINSLDLLIELEKKLGHKPKRDAVSTATLGPDKQTDGSQAIQWWQKGMIAEITELCCAEVKLIREVHEYGAKNGFVKYHDRFGQEHRVEVEWSLD